MSYFDPTAAECENTTTFADSDSDFESDDELWIGKPKARSKCGPIATKPAPCASETKGDGDLSECASTSASTSHDTTCASDATSTSAASTASVRFRRPKTVAPKTFYRMIRLVSGREIKDLQTLSAELSKAPSVSDKFQILYVHGKIAENVVEESEVIGEKRRRSEEDNPRPRQKRKISMHANFTNALNNLNTRIDDVRMKLRIPNKQRRDWIVSIIRMEGKTFICTSTVEGSCRDQSKPLGTTYNIESQDKYEIVVVG